MNYRPFCVIRKLNLKTYHKNIDDLEQKCLAEIVLVLGSLSFYRVTDRTLLVETFSADQ